MPCRLSRSCRQFRHQHAEFVDGYLDAVVVRAMQDHLDGCPDCAQHDVRVRRSLLALQVLPKIEPSEGFLNRLHARLAVEPSAPWTAARESGVRWGVVGAFVAASIALLFVASSASRPTATAQSAPDVAHAIQHSTSEPALVSPLRPPLEEPFGRSNTVPLSAPFAELAATTPEAQRSPRFETVTRLVATRRVPPLMNVPGVRLQLVSYPGQ